MRKRKKIFFTKLNFYHSETQVVQLIILEFLYKCPFFPFFYNRLFSNYIYSGQIIQIIDVSHATLSCISSLRVVDILPHNEYVFNLHLEKIEMKTFKFTFLHCIYIYIYACIYRFKNVNESFAFEAQLLFSPSLAWRDA